MNNEYEFSFIVGVLIRKHLRQMLESERFSGRDIRWIENKGWIGSTFRVRGNAADAKAIESRIDAYMKILDAA